MMTLSVIRWPFCLLFNIFFFSSQLCASRHTKQIFCWKLVAIFHPNYHQDFEVYLLTTYLINLGQFYKYFCTWNKLWSTSVKDRLTTRYILNKFIKEYNILPYESSLNTLRKVFATNSITIFFVNSLVYEI